MRKPTARLVAVATVLVLGGGVVAITATRQGAVPKEGDAPGAAAAPQAQVVSVTEPVPAHAHRTVEVPASLVPHETADLYAKTSGYVAAVHVDIGSVVTAGQALIEISVPEMAQELDKARAQHVARLAGVVALMARETEAALRLRSAKAQVGRADSEARLQRLTCGRKQELYDARAIPDQALDDARHTLAVAEAELSIAEADVARAEGEIAAAKASVNVGEAEVAVAAAEIGRLEALITYAVITAPCDGVITRRLVDPGAFVRSAASGSAAAPLLTIAATGRLRLVMEVPEPLVPLVSIGTEVMVTLPAIGGDPERASIARVAYALNPSTRTMRAEVDMDDRNGRIHPGMYAKALISCATPTGALVVPSAAIRARGGATYVLVVREGVAAEAPVTLGHDDGVQAQVISGLRGDELVITQAASAVALGVAVEAVPAGH